MAKPFISALIILVVLLIPSRSAFSATDQWGEEIGPGIEYRQFQLTDPMNNVFVTRMDRNNPSVTIESSLSLGNVAGDTETVSDMAQRYDDAINYWDRTWGNRNQVVVAINGYYFDYSTETAFSGQIHSGWYSRRFTDCATGSGGSGFAWKSDRSVFIGDSVSHPPDKQVVTFLDNGDLTIELDGLNVERGDNDLILYTPQYDSDTGTDTSGVEVLVEMDAPAGMIVAGTIIGTVRQIRDKNGSTPIPFDHIVLSATGNARTKLLDYVQTGDQIGISQKIKSYVGDCSTSPTGPDWTDTYASIAGAFYFLKDGNIRDFSDDPGAAARAPRTAIAFNDDYIFFIVVDGRDLTQSLGMTIGELAEFTRAELGATYGIAEDGGGSSTMVINGEVVNNTYCNINTCQYATYYLPMVSKSEAPNQLMIAPVEEGVIPLPTDQPEKLSADGLPLTSQYYVYSEDVSGPTLQRLVANGLMMVAVQPRDLSPIFIPGELVKTLFNAEVRLGPGSNYPVLDTVDAGAQGSLLEHAHGLNGVWAKGSYWWKVDFDGTVGWVTETSLTLLAR
jgi:hypothetical protein